MLGDEPSVQTFFAEIGNRLSQNYDRNFAVLNGTRPVLEAVLAVVEIKPNQATDAAVSASVVPNGEKYPPRLANDCDLATLYWPGALTWNNEEWLQLSWDKPREFETVTAYFLKHESMWDRTIRLQKQAASGRWEDLATSRPVAEGNRAVARFKLPARTRLETVRIVNLLDLFEIEVR